jgi:hypothetical protein
MYRITCERTCESKELARAMFTVLNVFDIIGKRFCKLHDRKAQSFKKILGDSDCIN